MHKHLYIFLILAGLLFNSCTHTQTINPNLTATQFSDKINAIPSAPVLDVRTPQEYSQGHLKDAVNLDFNRQDFLEQIATLDKSKPVFVYCLSGSRSTIAAQHMRSNGFEQVYELSGGIINWSAANLPLTNK